MPPRFHGLYNCCAEVVPGNHFVVRPHFLLLGTFTMFESLVSQVGGRFGLTEDKTKQLLGLLIGLIFNEGRGGPTAFLQSFRDKGLGDVVASWLGTGDNLPVNGSQISNVLGSDVINSFGNRLGLPGATVSDAAAALLPTAVSTLASNGTLELGALDRIRGWFGSLWDDGDDAVRTAAVGAGAVGASAAAATAAAVDREPVTRTTTTESVPPRTTYTTTQPERTSGGWWKWLLPLLALLVAIWAFRSCDTTDKDAAIAPSTAETPAVAPVDTTATDTVAAAGDSAAAALQEAEAKARTALGALTADSSTADFKAALDMVPIQFDTAKSTIKTESNAILDEAANTIKNMKAGSKIEIQGYTDSDGDDAANLKLSQERADAVKAALAQRGVSADILSTKGYGEANPIGDNATAEGKAKNRRIAYDIK